MDWFGAVLCIVVIGCHVDTTNVVFLSRVEREVPLQVAQAEEFDVTFRALDAGGERFVLFDETISIRLSAESTSYCTILPEDPALLSCSHWNEGSCTLRLSLTTSTMNQTCLLEFDWPGGDSIENARISVVTDATLLSVTGNGPITHDEEFSISIHPGYLNDRGEIIHSFYFEGTVVLSASPGDIEPSIASLPWGAGTDLKASIRLLGGGVTVVTARAEGLMDGILPLSVNQWSRVTSIGSPIRDIQLVDNDARLLVASDAGIFLVSLDDAKHMTCGHSGTAGARSLWTTPAGSAYLIAGVDESRMYLDRDAGSCEWTPFEGPTGESTPKVWHDVVTWNSDLLIATTDGIWRGEGASATWTRAALAGTDVTWISIVGDYLFAGVPEGLWVSTAPSDSSGSLVQFGGPALFVSAGTSPGEFWSGAGSSVFASSDGSIWVEAGDGLASGGVSRIVLVHRPNGFPFLLAASLTGFHVRNDVAAVWMPFSEGLGAESGDVSAILSSGRRIVIGTSKGNIIAGSAAGMLAWEVEP